MKRLAFLILAAILLVTTGCNGASDLSYLSRTSTEYAAIAVPTKNLSMSIDEQTLAVTVTNNENGHVWRSNEVIDGNELSSSWYSFATNGFTLAYYDSRAASVRRSYKDLAKRDTFTYTEDGVDVSVTFTAIGIGLKVSFRLESDGLRVSIPFDSIRETDPDYKLQYVVLMPFFGSSYGQTDGYIVVPDGSGAIIDLTTPTKAREPYTKRIYNPDYGITPAAAATQSDLNMGISMPVFGMSYADNAFISYIAKGAEYAEINASAAPVSTNYNIVYARYEYRNTYFRVLNNQGDGRNVVQENINQFDIEQHYFLLDGDEANYSGMAKRYATELKNAGLLRGNKDSTALMPIKIDFIMSDRKKSLFGHTSVTASRTDFVENALQELGQTMALDVTLKGYARTPDFVGGGTFSFDKGSGGSANYRRLIEFADQNGINLSLDMDIMRAEEGSVSKSALARSIADQIIVTNDPKIVYWYLDEFLGLMLVNPAATRAAFERQVRELASSRVNGVELKQMGTMLYSDYNKNSYNRITAADEYASLMSDFGFRYTLASPNQYLWQHTSAMSETPLGSTGYQIFTEDIPFLQLVIGESIQMFAAYANLYLTDSINHLRMVEFGVCPSYILTEDDPIVLMDTRSNYVFTSQYSTLKGDIEGLRQFMASAHQATNGAAMVKHEKISAGVYVSTYSNGARIAVNYGSSAAAFDGQTIQPRGYVVA